MGFIPDLKKAYDIVDKVAELDEGKANKSEANCYKDLCGQGASVDLNNLTNFGTYSVYKAQNSPVDTYGIVTVDVHDSNASYTHQFFKVINSTDIYYRCKINTNWGTWKILATQEYVSNIIKKPQFYVLTGPSNTKTHDISKKGIYFVANDDGGAALYFIINGQYGKYVVTVSAVGWFANNCSVSISGNNLVVSTKSTVSSGSGTQYMFGGVNA